MIKILLNAHADVHARDAHGMTALMYAASMVGGYRLVPDSGVRIEIAKLLLRAGAKVNAQNNEGHTALSVALAAENE